MASELRKRSGAALTVPASRAAREAVAPARGSGVGRYLRLMRVDRPVGTLLLLWPTLAALWLASEGLPAGGLVVAFTLGTLLARSAGCVVNDIVDQDFDGHVQRTRLRPLPQREVSLVGALVLLALLALGCLGVVLALPPLAQLLALGGAAVAVLYPFLKRWTHWPQAALGVAFSWGIPMAYAAVRGTVPADAWLLFLASLVWIVGYDTVYAMVDRDDDERIGVKSTAVLFGRFDRALVGATQAVALGLLVWLGSRLGLGFAYYGGLAVSAALFAHQQRLIRHRQRAACLRAFGNNAWVGFAVFAGVAAEYALRALP